MNVSELIILLADLPQLHEVKIELGPLPEDYELEEGDLLDIYDNRSVGIHVPNVVTIKADFTE